MNTDLLLLAGAVCIVAGTAAFSPPLAAIVAGVIMLAAALLQAAYNVRSGGPEA